LRFGSTLNRAMFVLQQATEIQSSHLGPVSAPSCYAVAYRHVLEQPDAAKRFQALFASATPAGRIYALAGLYDTDRPTFSRLLDAELQVPRNYTIVNTCIESNISAAEVRKNLEDGVFSAWWRPRPRGDR